jgi:undecaprenyl diphosphate synthase
MAQLQLKQIDEDMVSPARSDMPSHVAIIMDGNRRWAEDRGLPVFEGHRQGVEAVRRAVEAAIDLGINVLTIYSFSTENWSRPPTEVLHLMNLLKLFIRGDLGKLNKSNVQIRIIGDRENLAPDIARLLNEAESKTAGNTGLILVVAFNYGARQEMLRAIKHLAECLAQGDIQAEDLCVDMVGNALDTAGLPDPDLIIRTSGEQRLSNFLLWQSAYSELVFLPIYWPDFTRQAFEEAIGEYNQRERRFGNRKTQASG